MIYIYPPGTRDLSVGGVPLPEARNDRIVEVLNGRYDLEFDYPINGSVDLEGELEDFAIIGADTPRHGVQPFVVMKPIKREKYWHVEAKHVFFLLEVFKTGQLWMSSDINSILENIRINSDNPDIFTFSSNIPRRASVRYEGGPCMGVLADGEDSILAQARGELERDGYHVAIKDRIGEDTEHLLAQRKNIHDPELVKDYSKIVTRLNVSKLIDHEKFIPKENGKGRLTEAYPKSGGASLRVRYWDGTTGQLIEDGEGSFQVFDANGYSIIGGMQTGSYASIKMWKDRKTKYEETLKKDRERLPELEKRLRENKEKLAKYQGERKTLMDAYNKNTTQSNRKKVESKDRSIESTNKSIKNTTEQIKKTKEKIAEFDKLLKGVPTVILGERKLDNVLAKGEYFIRMTRPANGYIMDHKVKRIQSDGSKEIVVDFHSNPTHLPEDDTVWVESTVDSPIIGEYPYVFSRDVELEDDELEVWNKDQPWILDFGATQQNLYNWAYEEFMLTRMDLPSEKMTFTAGSEVMKTGLGLGDRAMVHFTDYKLYKDLPVREIVYSPMEHRYISLSFGDEEESFFSSLKKSVSRRARSGERRLERNLQATRRETTDIAETKANEVFRNTADLMDLAELQNYFDSEYIKQGLLEYADKVGAENLSIFEVEMLHLTLWGEELDAKYGTVREVQEKNRQVAKEMQEQIDGFRDENAKLSQEAKDAANQALEDAKAYADSIKSEQANWDLTGDGRNYFAVKFLDDEGYAEVYLGPNTEGERWFTISNGCDASGSVDQWVLINVYAYLPGNPTPQNLAFVAEKPGYKLGEKEGEKHCSFSLPDGVNVITIAIDNVRYTNGYPSIIRNDPSAIRSGEAKVMLNRGRERLTWQPHYLDVEAGMYDVRAEVTKAREYVEIKVGNVEGQLTSVKADVTGLRASVTDATKAVSSYEQTVKGFSQTVRTVSGQYSEIKQTVDEITKKMGNDSGSGSVSSQTVQKIYDAVFDRNGASMIQQTSDRIDFMVTNNTKDGGVSYYDETTKTRKWVNSDAYALMSFIQGNIFLQAERINLSGYVSFTELNKPSSEARDDKKTIIHGSRIETASMKAEVIGAGRLQSKIMANVNLGNIALREPVSWINLDNGEFSFMRRALYHNGRSENRGELWCTSSFAIAYVDRPNLRMAEFNAGGLSFYDKKYYFDPNDAEVGKIYTHGEYFCLWGVKGNMMLTAGRSKVYLNRKFTRYGRPDAIYDLYVEGSIYATGVIRAGEEITGKMKPDQ